MLVILPLVLRYFITDGAIKVLTVLSGDVLVFWGVHEKVPMDIKKNAHNGGSTKVHNKDQTLV